MVLHTTPCEVWSVGCGRVSSAGSGLVVAGLGRSRAVKGAGLSLT